MKKSLVVEKCSVVQFAIVLTGGFSMSNYFSILKLTNPIGFYVIKVTVHKLSDLISFNPTPKLFDKIT